MNKTLSTAAIGLLILGALYLWQSGTFSPDEPAGATASSEKEIATESVESSSVATESDTESEDATDAAQASPKEDETAPDDADSEGVSVVQSTPSPFAVIEEDVSESSDVSSPEVSTASTAEETLKDASETSRAVTGDTVVVPDSYPVTDAAKYFVPKEERGPGNLGGPPPLNFPGGPSDPNQTPTDGGALLPPPPGQ